MNYLSTLKGGDGNCVTELIISEQLWRKMRGLAEWNIDALLGAAQNLLTYFDQLKVKDDSLKACAGLYTYALEEFGKLLYLNSCKPSDGKVVIEYKKKFRNHDHKFKLVLNSDLPEECKLLHQGNYGSNYGGNYDVNTVANLKSRLGVFYSDFSDDGKSVAQIPTVSQMNLEIAVSKLKDSLSQHKTINP